MSVINVPEHRDDVTDDDVDDNNLNELTPQLSTVYVLSKAIEWYYT